MKGDFNGSIAFEVSPMVAASGSGGDKSGVYRYTYNLIRALSDYLKENHPDVQVYLFCFSEIHAGDIKHHFTELLRRDNISVLPVRPLLAIRTTDYRTVDNPLLRIYHRVWNAIYYRTLFAFVRFCYLQAITHAFRRLSVLVLHHSDTIQIYIPGTVHTISINDLSAQRFPELQREETVRIQNNKLSFARDYCDGIIAISEFTKQELIDYTEGDIPHEKIRVTHLGGPIYQEDGMRFEDLQKSLKDRSGIVLTREGYLLFTGTFDPRKNICATIEGYIAYRKTGSTHCTQLVIAGGKGWGGTYERAQEIIKATDKHIRSSIVIAGYVDDDELDALYRHAYALAYPSSYEGFGLPIVEAFAANTPVIASKAASIPEVCGDACEFCDPVTAETIKDALFRLENSALRNTLTLKGTRRTGHFSWDTTAQQTFAYYQELVNGTNMRNGRDG